MGRCLLSLVFVGIQVMLSAQPENELKAYKSKYPNEDKIVLKQKETIDITIKNGRPVIISGNYEEILWLSDKANYQRKDAVYYGYFNKLKSFSAATLVPEKNKYRELGVKDFKKTDYLESGIFYDDLQVLGFTYPNLSGGCKTIKKYENIIEDPRFLSSFFFGSYDVIEKADLEISVPKQVKLNYKLINCKGHNIVHNQKTKGKKIVHTWHAENIQKADYEPEAPGLRALSPHIVYYIEEYVVNGLTARVFSNTADLHSWYSNIVEHVNDSLSPALKNFVDSLTKGITNEMDIVEKVYYWVQDNVKYIAIEYGMGGFEPRAADLVFKRRYGDCKDKANLTCCMLEMCKVKSYLSWVGTRDIPYSYSDVPTPVVDNHMIVTYINNGKYYFLDPTGSYQPIKYPTAFIQGKEAMLNISNREYEIAKIPVIDASENIQFDSVFAKIENDSLTGFGSARYTGYEAIHFNRMINNHKEDEIIELLENGYLKGSNKYKIVYKETKNLGNRNSFPELHYKFIIPGHVISDGDNLYINLSLDKSFLDNKMKKDRKNDFIFDYKSIIDNIVVMEIPDGYSTDFLPGQVEEYYGDFGFKQTHTLLGNKVECRTTISNSSLQLSKWRVADWNKMINTMQKAYSSAVILKKN